MRTKILLLIGAALLASQAEARSIRYSSPMLHVVNNTQHGLVSVVGTSVSTGEVTRNLLEGTIRAGSDGYVMFVGDGGCDWRLRATFSDGDVVLEPDPKSGNVSLNVCRPDLTWTLRERRQRR